MDLQNFSMYNILSLPKTNKRQKLPKGQSEMDNPEKLAT